MYLSSEFHQYINETIRIFLKIESIMVSLEFRPEQTFDAKKHIVDLVAKQYLEKASSDVHHLVPVAVNSDGNCLYNSIVLLMNNRAVTANELRGMPICSPSTC